MTSPFLERGKGGGAWEVKEDDIPLPSEQVRTEHTKADAVEIPLTRYYHIRID